MVDHQVGVVGAVARMARPAGEEGRSGELPEGGATQARAAGVAGILRNLGMVEAIQAIPETGISSQGSQSTTVRAGAFPRTALEGNGATLSDGHSWLYRITHQECNMFVHLLCHIILSSARDQQDNLTGLNSATCHWVNIIPRCMLALVQYCHLHSARLTVSIAHSRPEVCLGLACCCVHGQLFQVECLRINAIAYSLLLHTSCSV